MLRRVCRLRATSTHPHHTTRYNNTGRDLPLGLPPFSLPSSASFRHLPVVLADFERGRPSLFRSPDATGPNDHTRCIGTLPASVFLVAFAPGLRMRRTESQNICCTCHRPSGGVSVRHRGPLCSVPSGVLRVPVRDSRGAVPPLRPDAKVPRVFEGTDRSKEEETVDGGSADGVTGDARHVYSPRCVLRRSHGPHPLRPT